MPPPSEERTPFVTACHAMATRFEFVLHGEDAVALRAAAEEAIQEIERFDAQLSLHRAGSDIWRINRFGWERSVKVEPRLFNLLERAREVWRATDGAFDPTVGPLMEVWGFRGGAPREPDADALREARDKVGFDRLKLDADEGSVRLGREGMRLDLGSIGKGYALDAAVEVLREAGVAAGLVHGGTSSICVWGRSEGEAGWRVALPGPSFLGAPTSESSGAAGASGTVGRGSQIELRDESLSVSAPWGRQYEVKGRVLGHVMDPRTGEPVERDYYAAVAAPMATETDAWSTALLVLGEDWAEARMKGRHGMRCWFGKAEGDSN